MFEEVNELIDQIKENLPWKVVSVQRAEADDLMLVLAREFNSTEKILIYSPDKDMIQAQRNTNNVFQYSSLTKKWLKPEHKSNDMNSWIHEHCVLGDSCDDVPKVVDFTEFSDSFIDHLQQHDIQFESPLELRESSVPQSLKKQILADFNVYKKNRSGEFTEEKDVFKKIRFGPSTLKKKENEYGSIDNWIDSNPLYREHYDRNFTLVMEEGIPDYIKASILDEYKDAKTEYNIKPFEDYLISNNLKNISLELPCIFRMKRELTADDFGW